MNTIAELLRSKHLKVTPARVAILEVFAKQEKPLNAKQVTKGLKSKDINQTTVYRTLTSLELEGIIKKVE